MGILNLALRGSIYWWRQGPGLIDQSQKMTVAAMALAEKKE